jgi:hypothetical protein
VARVAITGEQLVDQLPALLRVVRADELLPLRHRRDAPCDVQIQAAHQHIVRGGRVRLKTMLLPVGSQQLVDLGSFRQSGSVGGTSREKEEGDLFHGVIAEGRQV